MIIYKITNTINGKLYIGQTIGTLKRRFQDHCLVNKSAISKAIKKYGKDKFTIEIIYTASSLEELNLKEAEFIAEHNCIAPNGYNLREGGNSSSPSTISRKRMSESAKKKPRMTKETKLKLSEATRGEKHHFYGKKLNDHHKKILSDHAKTRIGEKNPMFNKNHSDKVKQDQSDRAAGDKNGMSKLNIDKVKEIRYKWDNGLNTAKELGIEYGVSHRTIHSVVYRLSWKHI